MCGQDRTTPCHSELQCRGRGGGHRLPLDGEPETGGPASSVSLLCALFWSKCELARWAGGALQIQGIYSLSLPHVRGLVDRPL